MIVAFLVGILAILLVANRQAEREADLTSSANAGVWLLAVLAFIVLLSVASVLGAALADPRIVAKLVQP